MDDDYKIDGKFSLHNLSDMAFIIASSNRMLLWIRSFISLSLFLHKYFAMKGIINLSLAHTQWAAKAATCLKFSWTILRSTKSLIILMLTFCFAAAFHIPWTLRDHFEKFSKWGNADLFIRIEQQLLGKLPQSLYVHLQLGWGLRFRSWGQS